MRKKIGIFLVCIMLVTSIFVIVLNDNVKAADAYAVFYPTDDTFVTNSYPDKTRGWEIHIKTKTQSGYEKYAMVYFDISSILPGTDICSAKLKLLLLMILSIQYSSITRTL